MFCNGGGAGFDGASIAYHIPLINAGLDKRKE